MRPFRRQSARAALPAILLAFLGASCASPPSRLYLLSGTDNAPPAQTSAGAAVSGSSQPVGRSARAKTPVVGVAVTVPEYLDRLDIMERTSANELKPIYTAQWGENLATTATRAVTENLMARLPSDDVITLPSRSRRDVDFQVNLDLTKFERDAEGSAVMVGRWSILDGEGTERASGRVQHRETAEGAGYDAMAAAMSRNLAVASGEIATALGRLAIENPSPAAPPRTRGAPGQVRR